jgi:hypothetical protein
MADMKTKIEITADATKAKKAVDGLSDSLENASDSAKKAGAALSSAESDASAAASGLDDVGSAASGVEETGEAVEGLTDGLKNLERQTNALGKSLTKVVSGPLLALAGISLKNLYDTGAIQNSEGPARQFALAIQDLQRSFRDLTAEIGQQVGPVFTRFVQLVSDGVRAFKSLDEGTKQFVISFGLILAAVGPSIVIFANLLKLFNSLGPAVTRIGGLLSSIGTIFSSLGVAVGKLLAPLVQLVPGLKAIGALSGGLIAAIGALVVTIAGLANVFFKLKKAGVDTADALRMSFNLFVTGFNNFVVGTILDGVSIILKALGSLSGAFSKSIGDSLQRTASIVDGWSRDLSSQFQSAKGNVDSALESVGSSAAEALTFGFSTKLGQLKDNIVGFFSPDEMGGQLSSEMGKMMDETYRRLELMQKRHQLNLEMANFEHQKKMQEIDTSQDPSSYLEQRLQAHREFLQRKHELDRQDLALTQEIERQKLQAIEDVDKRRIAEKELRDKQLLESEKLAQDQSIELVQDANNKTAELFKNRYQEMDKYVSAFSSGLSNSFIEIASGTETLGKSLEKFAQNFLKQIAQMILQAQIYKSVMSGVTGFGFSEGGPVGPAVRRASGGYIRGPGSGTSDSIPAWLSNGEYVIKAASVKKLGVRFLDGLNNISSGGVIPSRSRVNGFAEGGLVPSASAAPQVIIQNNGTPKEVSQQSFDPKTMVTTIILEDISKNGPVSKGMQNKFGLKMGGFS